MNPWSLIVLAVLALVWGYSYIVRTTPFVLGGRELRCAVGLCGCTWRGVLCRGCWQRVLAVELPAWRRTHCRR